MIKSISLLCLIVLLFEPISPSSYRRFRRQINSVQNRGSAYDSRAPHAKVPSGSIGGTAYYGIDSDPNYGSHVARPNRPGGGGFETISYDHNSQYFNNLIKPSHAHQQQPSQGNYQYNSNNNNLWQRPNGGNYNYQPYNPNLPYSQGWYATRNQQANQRWNGNQNSFWSNQGQSIIAYPSLVFITLTILLFCK